jgi:hypothetical protein
MTISQRNGTSATSVSGNDVYTIDRYKGWANGGGVFSVTQSTTAPAGFANSALITVTTADSSIAASDNYRFAQVIEGYNIADLNYGSSNAKSVTLSFWVQSSVTGTFGGSFYSSPATRSYVFNYTISSANTWTYITTTATGDTSGSWNSTNGQGMTIYFDVGSGSNYENATGAWVGSEKFRTSGNATLISTLNATMYITGVQLEAGTTASPFEYRQYGTELLLCQRYYETSAYPDVTFTSASMRGGVCFTGGNTASGYNFLVPKRSNSPTVTLYSRSNASGAVSLVATGADVTGCTASGLNATGFRIIALGSAQTAGAGIESGWTVSSEL